MSLYEKMYAVMNESDAVEKSMSVGSGSNAYKAVSEAAILNMIKPLFKKHKLIIFPINGDIKDHCMTWEKTDFNGKSAQNLRAMTELKVTYRILDIETGDFQDVVGFGNGADPQDKGAGKAFTYSLKNVLSKTFMLFSGEDTDSEHSDDIGKDKRQPSSSKVQGTQHSKPQQQPQNNTNPIKCTKVQLAELFKLSSERKAKFPAHDLLTLLNTMFENGRISTKYTYGDKEKTKINWTTEDYNSIKDELLLPF